MPLDSIRDIGGELSNACAHRTGLKRSLKHTNDPRRIERLKARIKDLEITIAKLQGLPPTH
jgi:hypothetical protein